MMLDRKLGTRPERYKKTNREVQPVFLVKAAGGFWNKKGSFWELSYREAVSLGLENRIMND